MRDGFQFHEGVLVVTLPHRRPEHQALLIIGLVRVLLDFADVRVFKINWDVIAVGYGALCRRA